MNNDSAEQNSKAQATESQYEPTYNLKAVVQVTGLKADTLRAWERRYGLPKPTRTESGHRLYSKRDIGILRWLLARQAEGLSISRAVALWQRLADDGIDPIDEDEISLSSSSADTSTSYSSSHPASSSMDLAEGNRPSPNWDDPLIPYGGHLRELRHDWISACLNYDETKAEQVLASAFSLFDMEMVCIELLFKGISEIGIGWDQGRVTAQQEHFASSLATRRLHALLNGVPAPTRVGKILIGCPSGEEHVFPSHLLALLLRRYGWNVLFLGANIPIKDLTDTVLTTRPTLVILTAQQLYTAATLMKMGNTLLDAGIPLAYGGAVFARSPELQRCIAGYYLGDDIGQVALIVEQLMASPRVKPAQRNMHADYVNGLHSFQQSRTEIENQVWQTMQTLGLEEQLVAAGNRFLADTISASLSLCGVGAIEPGIDDVATTLVNHHGIPAELVEHYLGAYYHAIHQQCNDVDPAMMDWFSQILAHYQRPIFAK